MRRGSLEMLVIYWKRQWFMHLNMPGVNLQSQSHTQPTQLEVGRELAETRHLRSN